MSYTKVLRRVREQRIPHSATLELTYSCNLDCFFCYNDKDAEGSPLSLEQYRRLLEGLARLQVLYVSFTGGEPMVHPRFFEIGRTARDLGFVVGLRTNGHMLRRSIAKRLQDQVDPFMVEMSLHGAKPETHDRQTRLPGSFERLIDNIRGMRDLGLRQSLISTLTAWNQDELEDMYALADDLGVPFSIQGPVGMRGGGDRSPLQIQPSAEAVALHLRLWESRRDAGNDGSEKSDQPLGGGSRRLGWPVGSEERFHCGAGSEGIRIDPFGNVYPCLHLKWSAGNLYRQSIEEIWNRSPVFDRARELSFQTARRLEGKPISQLGSPVFCPALDLHLQGCGGCEPD